MSGAPRPPMATLDFKGKSLVQNYHLSVKYHQLVPKKDKSLTEKVRLDDNLIIHGDNLKALKALLPTYAGRVKCIYIDPPYNTGNEGWAYNDNVSSPMLQEWLGKTVDRDDLTRHDKWLCMMLPRLKLLNELMSNEGVMVKLDLHITNKQSTRWQDTMLASKARRDALEAAAKKYEANTGNHIRPICLVQVERTGKEQRGGNFIHAEDVREYLVKDCGIPADEVAVKSSEKDDIEGMDLFARNCAVRYIITKQALQEGWDCSFAYVLTILTNPASRNGLTQLVGRILRQPFARKTKIRELDESYVYCFRQSAKQLVDSVREGFGQEGLGDLAGQVVLDSADDGPQGEETFGMREQFKKFAGTIYLPTFVIQQGAQWREVSYETDIVSRIDWTQADFSAERNLQLADAELHDLVTTVTLGETKTGLATETGRKYLASADAGVNLVFATRQMLEVVPNPWIAHDIAKDVTATLSAKWGADMVARNFVFVVQQLVKRATTERDRLAEEIFVQLVSEKQLRFLLLKDDTGYRLPDKIKIRKGAKKLVRDDNSPLQMSLFEQVAEDWVNGDERSVAWYFDKQGQLLWWYRNLSRADYRIQGWRKHGIFPDFIASHASPADKTDFDKVFVVESKGIHLKGNDDTAYKEKVFKLCNRLAEEKSWTELGLEFPERKIVFELVFGDEWQKKLNGMFAG
jgi:type III restriction enzyme